MLILNKVIEWVKANYIIALIGVAVISLIFFNKPLMRLFGVNKTKRRRSVALVRSKTVTKTMRKPLPRSVNTAGKVKKAWQIKGSEAARRHMARIRKLRS